jgi:alkylation response protein AidB-like acyl-CoA dehydrogenase
MDLELTEEQDLIVRTARDFAARVLAPRAAERDRTEAFPTEELLAMAQLGLLAVNVPSELGGAQAGAVAYALAMMEIAYADASVAVAMAVSNMAAELIVHWGTPAQRQKYVPLLASGAACVGSFALSEPQAGSDPSGLATRAVKTASGYRINGTKQWITSGNHAGVFVVWAKVHDENSAPAMTAFVLEKGMRGLSCGRPEDKMGLRGSATVPLLLEDVEVTEEALLGKVGQGLPVALSALDGGRIGIASQAIGIASAALDASVRYAKERVQFERPLAQHQAIQLMLADMVTWRDAARLLVLRAAWRKQHKLPITREASIAKLFATERTGKICDLAVQIHGGYGYTRDFPVERYLRDARVTRIYEGTSEVQRIVIARQLLRNEGPAS